MVAKEEYQRLQRNCSQAVSRAVRNGELRKANELKCADCGQQAIGYDHRNYYRPLEVDPICHDCNVNRGQAYPYYKKKYPLIQKSFKDQPLGKVFTSLYGSIRNAAKKLKYNRQSLYFWIEKGYIPDNAFKRWKAQGINYRGLGQFRKSK